jgi:hypothetical protein
MKTQCHGSKLFVQEKTNLRSFDLTTRRLACGRLRIGLAGRPVTEHSMEATGYGIRKAVQVRCFLFGAVNFHIVDHSAGKLWIASMLSDCLTFKMCKRILPADFRALQPSFPLTRSSTLSVARVF